MKFLLYIDRKFHWKFWICIFGLEVFNYEKMVLMC